MKTQSSSEEKNDEKQINMNKFPGDIDIYDDSEFSVHFKNKNTCEIIFFPLYKIFFKYPAKITKILFQIGDLYCFIEILCFNLQFFLILITSAARIQTIGKVFIFIGLFLFSLLFGNALTVPLWEFIQFRWLKNILFVQTWFDIWCIGYNDEMHENNEKHYLDNNILYKLDIVFNILFGAFLYVYIVLLAIGNPVFDYFTLMIVLIIPSLKIVVIYILYFILFCWKMHDYKKIKYYDTKKQIKYQHYYDPFILAMKNKYAFSLYSKVNKERNNKNNDKVIITRFKQEKLGFLILKIIGFVFGLCYMIWISINFKVNALMIVNFVIFLIYNFLFALSTQMPIWIFDYFKNWDCGHIINPSKGINARIRKDPKFKGFKYVNSICTFIIPLLIIAYAFFLFSCSSSTFTTIESQTFWNGTLSHYYDQPTKTKEIMSAMCYTQVYHLNFLQIGSIAAASYYKDNERVKLYLENSFFSDDNLIISYLDHVLKDDDHAVLLRADIDIKDSSKNLTIFAVRGSTTAVDWWLDFEIFISSALLSFARWFPIVNSFESVTARAVSRYMTFPLYTMYQATLSYQYTSEMFAAIDNFTNHNPERTILFTGHSLGGGLSKILAHKYAKQSVAFSGPGISAIENKFKPKNYDKYFKSKYIDIVPDNDFVPRFELSGGTRHRVLCQQNGGECHSILRTLCQIGLSCDFEKYTGDFCHGIYSKDEYDEMMELADYSR